MNCSFVESFTDRKLDFMKRCDLNGVTVFHIETFKDELFGHKEKWYAESELINSGEDPKFKTFAEKMAASQF